MLDVLLSLVVVGIPERTASEGRGVEVEGAGGSDEECRAQDVDERVEAGQASLDTVEGLLLDGTLAFHVDAVADAPWSCIVPPKSARRCMQHYMSCPCFMAGLSHCVSSTMYLHCMPSGSRACG